MNPNCRLSLPLLILLSLSPVTAQASWFSNNSDPATTAPAAPTVSPGAPQAPIISPQRSLIGSSTATTKVTSPQAPKAPQLPTAPVAPTRSIENVADSVKAGDLSVSNAKIIYRKDDIDVFFSIANNGAADEKLSSADSTWKNAALVLVTKGADGKEVESPFGTMLPAGKTTDFTDGHVWLRMKNADKPKDTDTIPVSLSFRRSPNAKLNIAAKGSAKSGSLTDWINKD